MSDYFEEAKELFEYTRLLRRDFHRHPELGFQEVRTAGIVGRELRALGLEVTSGIGKTGVVAMLEGSRPGRTVMVRADMDALPIVEESGAEYASETPGVMHACGHDAHTAVGITVARLLVNHRDHLAGNIKFVFQPAEEGLGGAESMITDGVLENLKPDVCLGLHVWNEKPVGWIGIGDGPMMAAGEIFKVRITGKGGHGAAPHRSIDPVLAAAQVITALQSIVARNTNPVDTAVVSVTMIHGGEAFNVIPPAVELEGTIRTFLPEVRAMVLARFEEIVTGVAEAMGCEAEIDIKLLTPAVINDVQIAQVARQAAREVFPDDTIEDQYNTMGSEDFAFFMQKIPGCFMFIGSANAEKGLNAGHHHPRFNIDEDVLPRAVALMASAAMKLAEG